MLLEPSYGKNWVKLLANPILREELLSPKLCTFSTSPGIDKLLLKQLNQFIIHSSRFDIVLQRHFDFSLALYFFVHFVFPWLLKRLSIFSCVYWPFKFLMWICFFLSIRYISTFWIFMLCHLYALQLASPSPQAD